MNDISNTHSIIESDFNKKFNNNSYKLQNLNKEDHLKLLH